MKSENLIFLEPSGPLQDCNGTALPLTLQDTIGNEENFEMWWVVIQCEFRELWQKIVFISLWN